MLRAIAFDLWETLITETPGVARQQERLRTSRLEEILSARGYGALADRIEHAHRALWKRCHELYWSEDRDIPCRRQVEHFLEELEIEIDDEATLAELEQAYATAAVEVLPDVVSGAPAVLADLKSRGLRIGLISNTGRTPGYALREVLARLGLAQSIDVMVFSNEHGYCKPQTSIFEELRRGLGVGYEEMMFVGDNLYVDVHGAQRCGIRAVHFKPVILGNAIAPPVEHGLQIVADDVVTSLSDIVDLVDDHSIDIAILPTR